MATTATLLETGEVARMLGLSVERVRAFAEDGRLPVAMRVGVRSRRLFKLDDVMRLKAARERAGR